VHLVASIYLLQIRVIEANLDAKTKTPRIHRDELIRHVHVPELLKIQYLRDLVDPQTLSPVLKSLVSCYEDADNRLKNEIFRLLSEDEIAKLPAADIKKRKLIFQAQDQLRRFSDRARYVQEELGHWAADYYITESINRVTLSMHKQQNRHLDWQDEQAIHILNLLGQVHVSELTFDTQLQMDTIVLKKCASVLSFLQNKASDTFRGIIFVEQRVTVFVLSHLLSVYPGTKSLFKCGTFVGMSTDQRKTMELRDLLDPQNQQNTLKDFDEGRKNLLIATSVLEEGIDISACNVVICFNKPPNLKSYVQRRGRARQEKSTMVLLSSPSDEADVAADWQKMESEMVAEYMRDGRDSIEAEGILPNEVNNDTRILRVDSTR
jgi:ERCC4-related helicase